MLRGPPGGPQVSGVPLGGPGGVKTTSRMARSCREDIPEGGKGSGGPPKGLGRVWRPFWRAGRSWETLPNGQEGLEALLEGQRGTRGHSGGPGEVGRPSRRVGRGREALPEGGRGREALLEGREELGGPPKGPGGVERPYRRAKWHQ